MRTLGQPDVCLERAHDIVGSMPDGTFSTSDFLTRAISMNAVDHCNDVLPMLDHLVEVGAIMAMDSTGTSWLRNDAAPGRARPGLEPSWSVVAERELAGVLAAPVARAVVRTTVDDVLGDDDLSDAILVTSELVTNAVVHTAGPVHLTVCRDRHADRARIAVRDLDPTHVPVLRHPSPLDPGGGRGLRVVEALATWGTVVDVAHKEVWAEVPKPTEPVLTQKRARRG
jgi:anti-sigma regulatory factor (Ser/Thr protein kinase)